MTGKKEAFKRYVCKKSREMTKRSKKELKASLVLKEGSRGTFSCPASISGPVSGLEEGASRPLRLECLATPC